MKGQYASLFTQELALELFQELCYRHGMSRRPIHKRNIRKLTRTGGGKSVSVVLPIEYVRELKWQDRQKVVVEKRGSTLVIKDWKK